VHESANDLSGHTALNVKTFGYSTSCAPRSVLGALLPNGPERCQAGIRAANTRNNASALTVSVGPQISSGYFGIAASRHSETMPNHLSLRSHSICEAVHTPCDRCREIDKNVMPVTPCFPTRTSLLGLFSRICNRCSGHDLLRNYAFAVAIGGKADMGCCTAYVCFCPKRTWPCQSLLRLFSNLLSYNPEWRRLRPGG
jgi:hypothetical protein